MNDTSIILEQSSPLKSSPYLINTASSLDSQDNLAFAYEDLVNQVFDKLEQDLLQKVLETKEKVLEEARRLYSVNSRKILDSNQRFGSQYKIDFISSLMDSLNMIQTGTLLLEQKTEGSIQDIKAKKTQEDELADLAKQINNYANLSVEAAQKALVDLQNSLSSAVLDKCLFGEKTWSWSPLQNSCSIVLSEDSTIARKRPLRGRCHPATVRSAVEISSGYHQWELKVASGYENHEAISFGIIETHMLQNLGRELPNGLGVSTNGQIFMMEKEKELEDYDNKVFLCDLDMENGVFTISYEGEVVAQQSEGIKGRVFAPYAKLLNTGNNVELKMVRTLQN